MRRIVRWMTFVSRRDSRHGRCRSGLQQPGEASFEIGLAAVGGVPERSDSLAGQGAMSRQAAFIPEAGDELRPVEGRQPLQVGLSLSDLTRRRRTIRGRFVPAVGMKREGIPEQRYPAPARQRTPH